LDPLDTQLEIIVGAGTGSGSRIETYDTASLAAPTNSFFAIFTGSGSNAPVRVAAADSDFNNGDDIFAAQGPDGKSGSVRRSLNLGAFVDFVLENHVEFRNGFFIGSDVNGVAFICS